MSDIDNTALGGNTTPGAGDKTFSQDDVNRIVGERLAKEKAKTEAVIADREKELAQRELALTAKERLTTLGLPVELHEALNATSKEALEKSITLLQGAFSQKNNSGVPKFTGFKPGEAGKRSEDDGDTDIRKAFGLPK